MPLRLGFMAAWLLGWAVVATFFASQTWLIYAQNGDAGPFLAILIYSLCTWGTWAAFAPAVIALSRRWPVERPRAARALAVHAAGAAVLIGAKLWVDAVLRASIGMGKPHPSWGDIHMALLTYAAVAGVVHVAAIARRAREREVLAAQLESRLAQARLQSLEAQLHPHFLFNTLHAVSALVHKDPAQADRTIALLADLLRVSLKSRGSQEVTLREELDFVRGYLEIEQTRLGDRLEVELRIDPAALDARLPSLALQPLVENAIRHGIAPRARKGSLVVAAARDGDTLSVVVEDDGVGLPASGLREGVGIANTRARLEQLYGAGEHLSLLSRDGGGVRAELRVPFREAP